MFSKSQTKIESENEFPDFMRVDDFARLKRNFVHGLDVIFDYTNCMLRVGNTKLIPDEIRQGDEMVTYIWVEKYENKKISGKVYRIKVVPTLPSGRVFIYAGSLDM